MTNGARRHAEGMLPTVNHHYPPRTRTLGDWMRVFRDGWVAFVVVLAAAIAAAALVTLRQPTLYGAKGILIV